MPRTQADEGNAVAMLRIHVGLHFEDEAGHRTFAGVDAALFRLLGAWRGSELAQTRQELSDAERIEGATEEERCHVSLTIRLEIELGTQAASHFDLFA